MDSGWTKRLREIREALGWTQRDMAERMDLTTTGWQNYEIGRNTPGGGILKGIFGLGVDMNWLFSGEGQMFRGAVTMAAEPPSSPTPTPETLQGRGLEQFLSDIGVMEIAPLASLGETMTEYAVMNVLVRTHPNPQSLEQVQQALLLRGVRLDTEHLLAFLHLLKRRGLVQLEQGQSLKFSLRTRTPQIVARDIVAHTQLAVDAVRIVLREVLPRATSSPSDASLMQIRLSIRPERAQKLIQELKQRVFACCEENTTDGSKSEVIVILALAHVSSNISG